MTAIPPPPPPAAAPTAPAPGPRRDRIALIILAAVVLAGAAFIAYTLVGQANTLSQPQQARVANYESAFSSTAITGARYRQTLEGVSYLIDLYRSDPDAKVSSGGDRTVGDVLEDSATMLNPSQPDLVRQIDRALDN